jgi:hypothetical protein
MHVASLSRQLSSVATQENTPPSLNNQSSSLNSFTLKVLHILKIIYKVRFAKACLKRS